MTVGSGKERWVFRWRRSPATTGAYSSFYQNELRGYECYLTRCPEGWEVATDGFVLALHNTGVGKWIGDARAWSVANFLVSRMLRGLAWRLTPQRFSGSTLLAQEWACRSFVMILTSDNPKYTEWAAKMEGFGYKRVHKP